MSGKNKRRGGKVKIRAVNPDTKNLAKKMLGHFIPYEIGMMRALHIELATGSSSQLDRNAKIESFHIHARNLMEFFKDDKQCAIDPRTFTADNYRIAGNFISASLENKISQQIVHLTHERTDVENDKLSDKERDRTVEQIEKQIERFQRALKPEWQSVWREGLSKMNFEVPKGPPPTFTYVSGPTGSANPTHLGIPSNSIAGSTNQFQSVSGPVVKQQNISSNGENSE